MYCRKHQKEVIRTGKGLFGRLFGRREREMEERRPPRDMYYEDEPPEMDNESLLVDHKFQFIPQEGSEKKIDRMIYELQVENTTDYPMGKLDVDFKRKSKLGTFGEPRIGKRMLDPDERMVIEIPFEPAYMGGKHEFEFTLNFFDFRYKVDERIKMKTEKIKVLVPKFKPMTTDEDGFRLLTSDLYRWSLETDVVEIEPKKLYRELRDRAKELGFKEAKAMENDSVYRGLTQMVAGDSKGRKWALQVQVIGQGKESKLLLYAFGERPQFAYNLATRMLHKYDRKDMIVDNLV